MLFIENDQEKSTKSPILISRNSPEITNSSASKVVGKLVSIKFLKSCPNPIITPLVSNYFMLSLLHYYQIRIQISILFEVLKIYNGF